MKKNLFLGIALVAMTFMFANCGGGGKMTVTTSTSVDLARSVRYIPTLANVQVHPVKVTATITAAEFTSLKADQRKQMVVAKAVASVGADVLVAPQFTSTKDAEGKVATLTVVGYPAKITSFRSLSIGDAPFIANKEAKQDRVTGRMVANTLTVAEVEYGQKVSLTLTPNDIGLAGQNEKKVFEYAKKKLLRDQKADLLYEPQYTTTIVDGKVSTFTITAFPGRYAKYRTVTTKEMEVLNVGAKPSVIYNTTADVRPVGSRVQLKFATNNATAKESEVKEMARSAALAKYKADFILNEKFYIDYQDKVITHVTICGTPAVYANFRPLKAGDVIDTRIMGFNGEAAEDDPEQPKGILDIIMGWFKKK